MLRGTLLPLARDGGMFVFLQRAGVPLLDLNKLVLSTSQRVKAAALGEQGLGQGPRPRPWGGWRLG